MGGMFESNIGKQFIYERLNDANKQVNTFRKLLELAERDLKIFQNCSVKESRLTEAAIKTFMVGTVIESPIYGNRLDKDSIAKMIFAMASSKTRTMVEKKVKTIYRPRGGKHRETEFIYDDRWKVLINVSERILLVFPRVTIVISDDDCIAPF